MLGSFSVRMPRPPRLHGKPAKEVRAVKRPPAGGRLHRVSSPVSSQFESQLAGTPPGRLNMLLWSIWFHKLHWRWQPDILQNTRQISVETVRWRKWDPGAGSGEKEIEKAGNMGKSSTGRREWGIGVETVDPSNHSFVWRLWCLSGIRAKGSLRFSQALPVVSSPSHHDCPKSLS